MKEPSADWTPEDRIVAAAEIVHEQLNQLHAHAERGMGLIRVEDVFRRMERLQFALLAHPAFLEANRKQILGK